MELVTPNIDLLDLVLKTIKADPDHWDQNHWRTVSHDEEQYWDAASGFVVYEVDCGTSFCFAGWAVQLGSQTTPEWTDDGRLIAEPEDHSYTGRVSASTRAARLLGLSDSQAVWLFAGGNTMEDIEHTVYWIKKSA